MLAYLGLEIPHDPGRPPPSDEFLRRALDQVERARTAWGESSLLDSRPSHPEDVILSHSALRAPCRMKVARLGCHFEGGARVIAAGAGTCGAD
ncbi:MAG TPA: hypothetical protein VHG93_02475 [Longimicrobium sp.]|nr:hypothetical protein [Longimicrobium sp.]